ncbi:MAG: hypothetical protein E7590_02145 [Ruminococcaceae bacterium]|nr:hypothetical protein [Oscillospiraceae bacterium]
MQHKLLGRKPVGNPRRVWKQDNLLISVASAGPMETSLKEKNEYTYRKTRRAVKTCVDAGFNLIGCLWADSKMAMEIVRAAEACGGNVQFQDLKRFGGMGRKNVFCEKNDYEGAIEDTKQWKCIKAYCLWDEPITEERLTETRRMLDYCEQVRPDVLPYTVANPDYNRHCRWEDNAYAPYIDSFLDTIDPVQMSFDYYPIGKPEYDAALQLDNSTMWSDLEIVRRAAKKRDIPMCFWYQAQRFPWHKVYYTFHFNMARSMAHAGVLHGCKGIECYTEFDGFVDPATGREGVFFEPQKRLNTELLNLGNTLMALTCDRVIHDGTLLPDHPAMEGLRTPLEESELVASGLVPRTSISEHTDPYGNRYLMVLNRDYEQTATLSLRLKKSSHIYEVSKKDGEQVLCEEAAMTLPVYLEPGDLKLYRIQDAAEDLYTIEYYLDK